jgi:hypothetical protein
MMAMIVFCRSSHDAIWKNKFIEEFVYETEATEAKQKAEEKVLQGYSLLSLWMALRVFTCYICCQLKQGQLLVKYAQ